MGKNRVKKRRRHVKVIRLESKYPPSKPCSCKICLSFCNRPGWWTVKQAAQVITAGYASRMMLEMSPDFTFGVLSPAFKGCESQFADYGFMTLGCTFLQNNLCELFGTGLQPLECRYCHHTRCGLGDQCHADIEKKWNSPEGIALVVRWSKMTCLWEDQVIADSAITKTKKCPSGSKGRLASAKDLIDY